MKAKSKSQARRLAIQMLKPSKGMMPCLEGYNPIIDIPTPEGFTAEYYGDDTIYIGYKGELVSMILPNDGVSNDTNKTRVEKKGEFVLSDGLEKDLSVFEDWIRAEISQIDKSYAIEEFASIHSSNRP